MKYGGMYKDRSRGELLAFILTDQGMEGMAFIYKEDISGCQMHCSQVACRLNV